MGNDNGFGRRNSPARSPAPPVETRLRRGVSMEQEASAAEEIPVQAETSHTQTLMYAAVGVVLMFGTVAIGLVGLPMLTNLWLGSRTVVANAEPAAVRADLADPAHVGPQADAEPASSKRAGTTTANSTQHQAAMKFFGFYHLNTRARAAYCGNLGVDMSAFNTKFRQTQTANHQRAAAIIARSGLSEDQVYEQSRVELSSAIASEQEQIAQKMGLPAAMGCAVMVKHADKVIPGIDFAKIMPEEHRTLTGS